MEAQRFINRYQPQLLVTATMLAYIQAVFDLLTGLQEGFLLLVVVAVGKGLGAFGIANSKRVGYYVCIAATVVGIIMLFVLNYSLFGRLLNLVFEGALLGALLHPQSRDYTKIWFE
ncbi:MAG: hypothetical protein ACR2QE_09045 [Acidimicrobiales bacterium]